MRTIQWRMDKTEGAFMVNDDAGDETVRLGLMHEIKRFMLWTDEPTKIDASMPLPVCELRSHSSMCYTCAWRGGRKCLCDMSDEYMCETDDGCGCDRWKERA